MSYERHNFIFIKVLSLMLDGITGLKEVKGLTPKYKVVDKYLLRGPIFFYIF